MSSIVQHKLLIPKTAHYATLGTPSQETKEFWIVAHGYGQLAFKFLQEFEPISTPERFIVAPEGLSRFYWNGFNGPVVSSWMTKEDRLDEIEDFCRWLDTIYAHFIPLMSGDVKIVLLGFSQGCATLTRWMMHAFPKVHHLILWGGKMPEDIDYQSNIEYLSAKRIHTVCGDNDPFINDENIQNFLTWISDQGLETSFTSFSGKHEMNEGALINLTKSI